MSNARTASTDLVCLECGNITSIYRRVSRLKDVGHIKDLWCFKCKKRTHHFEVRDVNIYMESLLSKDKLTLEEKEIMNLISKDGETYERCGVPKKILRKR